MTTPSKKRAPREIPVAIDNVGGIHHADLLLKPGVNELLGGNGAGKTSAMQAIRRAFGEKIAVEKRDGAVEGRITAPGIVVKLGKVVKATGEAELELADAGPLTRIIDPGMKGSDEAATARVRALVELLSPEFDADTLRLLAVEEEATRSLLAEFSENAFATLSDAAERARLILHRHAREAEAKAKEAAATAIAAERNAADALEKAGGEAALTDLTPSAAEALEGAARNDAAVARHRHEQRTALERQQEEIRETLGAAPDPAKYDEDIHIRVAAIIAHQQRIDELMHQVAREREFMAGIKADHAALVVARRGEEELLAKHRQQAEILARVIEGPTEEEVEQLEMLASAASEARRAAVVSAQVKDLRTRAEIEKKNRDEADAKAQRLRETATTVFDRLADLPGIAERSGRLTVIVGRLHVKTATGDLLDFETRQSEGQKIDVALEVAAQVYGEGAVVAIDDRYWLALDDEHRRLFAERAAAHGLFVVTARPTEGALRVENLTPKAPLTVHTWPSADSTGVRA